MPAAVAEAGRGPFMAEYRLPGEPHTSLCIVRSRCTHLPPPARLPAPLPQAALGSLVFAWLAMGMTVADPAADRARGQRDPGPRQARASCPWRWRSSAPAILRLGLTVVRRLIAGKVSLAVEFDLRQRFYSHLQALELGFFDSQQTGQLMSRATVDLQAIRFFLGYGLIFITQNLLTITLAAAVMFVLNPVLALIALAPAPFVDLHRHALQPALAPGAAGGPAADRRADRGGRGERLRDPHRQGVRARGAPAAPLPAGRRPGLRPEHLLDPAAGLLLAADRPAAAARHRAVLLVGGRQVINGSLSLGDFTAFYIYLVMLAAPMRMLGHRAGDGAARGRLRQPAVRDPRPRAADQEPARGAALPAGRRPGADARRDPALRRRRAGADRHRPRRRGRAHGRPGRAHRARARRAWWR